MSRAVRGFGEKERVDKAVRADDYLGTVELG